MKHIILIRHGQSRSQIDKTESGVNPDLSPYGEVQARALRERVKSLAPDEVLVSPLKRAFRTYQLSQIRCSVVRFDARLVEAEWGIERFYDGVDCSYLPKEMIEQDRLHDRAADRAESLVESLVASEAETFVLFGHWGIFSEIFRNFLGIPTDSNVRARAENTSLSRLDIHDDGTRSVEYWSDASHLNAI